MTTNARIGPERSQDARTSSGFPKWMSGAQTLGSSFAVFPWPLAGRWNRKGTVGTCSAARWYAGITSGSFTCSVMMLPGN